MFLIFVLDSGAIAATCWVSKALPSSGGSAAERKNAYSE